MTIEEILRKYLKGKHNAILIASEEDLNRAKMFLDLDIRNPIGYITLKGNKYILEDLPNDDCKINFITINHIAKEVIHYLSYGKEPDMEITL